MSIMVLHSEHSIEMSIPITITKKDKTDCPERFFKGTHVAPYFLNLPSSCKIVNIFESTKTKKIFN